LQNVWTKKTISKKSNQQKRRKRTIQKEFNLAFQDNEQAQRMKREVYGDFIKNHYEYFDLSVEDALGLEG
jgi:hypothetical protein